MRNIFLEKSYRKYGKETIPRRLKGNYSLFYLTCIKNSFSHFFFFPNEFTNMSVFLLEFFNNYVTPWGWMGLYVFHDKK